MKNKAAISGYLLLALIMMLPVGTIASSAFGYTFEFTSYPLAAGLTAVIAIFASIVVNRDSGSLGKSLRVLLTLSFPISLINAVFYILKCCNVWVSVGMIVTVICCGYLTIRFGQPLALKTASWIISALMLLPVGFLMFIALVFGSIGKDTVVKTIESPNGTYYAQVTDSDQGALGGDTLVEVYETGGLRTFLFEIIKKPQTIYVGEWGEFQDMKIGWKDDACLVISGKEYPLE